MHIITVFNSAYFWIYLLDTKSSTFEKSKTTHIRSVSFRDPIAALNHINQHHHREVLVSVRTKVRKSSKRYVTSGKRSSYITLNLIVFRKFQYCFISWFLHDVIFINLFIFEALLMCVLNLFVILMIVKSANEN